ncbi:Hypothetical predicted protein, partial [Podarcis lilfordi]
MSKGNCDRLIKNKALLFNSSQGVIRGTRTPKQQPRIYNKKEDKGRDGERGTYINKAFSTIQL